LSDPAQPSLVSSFPAQDYPQYIDAEIRGDRLYTVTNDGKLFTLLPRAFPFLNLSSAYDMGFDAMGLATDVEYVLIACGEYGLGSFSLEDPEIPALTGWFGDRGHCYESVTNGDYLYLALGEGGIEIFDTSDPLNPERLSVTRTPDHSVNLFIKDNLLYVALLHGGLLSMDISDKGNPRIINRFDEFGFVSDLAFTDSVAVMYCNASEQYRAGIYTFDYRNPEDIVVLGSVPVDNVRGINFTVADNKVFFVAKNNWFFNLDITDPFLPVQNWIVPSPGAYCHASYVVVKGDYAYVSYYDFGLAIINVSDPENMTTVSTLNYRYPSYFNRMQIVDSLLYVEDKGIRVFNIAEPTRPREIGHYTGGISVTGMSAKENYVYLSTLSQVITLDCSEALGVGQEIGGLQLPEELTLAVSPNPFNASATVRFAIPDRTGYKLNLYDHSGKLVRQIASGINNPGEHNETLDASSLSTGVYFINLKTETKSITRKALVMK